jgi:hypothetical protein
MPISFSELAQGQAFSRSSEDDGLHDSFDRVFKVLLSSPSEVYDPQDYCKVYIGDPHPFNPNQTCHAFDAKFDGESRMVNIITFKYRSFSSQVASGGGDKDPKQNKPDIRLANWTTDVTLIERPSNIWRKADGTPAEVSARVWSAPLNPVGDRYDDVTRLRPIVTIRVEQFESSDPLKMNNFAGFINDREIKLGTYTFPYHTVMFRGVTHKPHSETFGTYLFRGWLATYELMYDPNRVYFVNADGSPPADGKWVPTAIGWDRLQILEGFNVLNNRKDDPDVDWKALALKHQDGKILFSSGVASYADNVQNTVTRAMVTVPEYQNGGLLQRPSSSPVALNADGTPRNLWKTQSNGYKLQPLMSIYQTQPDCDLVNTLQLRLTN